MKTASIALAVAVSLASCQTLRSGAAEPDEAVRSELLGAVKALEGNWEATGADGQPQMAEFRVSSGGTAVREVMFPGTDHEMTNMYHLDGNALVLTHYCAGGNQPRMVATEKAGDSIAFHFDSVSDRKGPDQAVMGEMTLELVDADHMEQHWIAFQDGAAAPDHEMHFSYRRARSGAR